MAKKKIEPSKVEPVMEMSTNGIPTFKFKMTNINAKTNCPFMTDDNFR